MVATPVLRVADAEVRFTSPTECEVVLTSAVDGASTVEHRLEVVSGSRVELVEVSGASIERPPFDIGRTRAIVVRRADGAYGLTYRVELPSDRAFRCPLWVPTVPADGRSREVRLVVYIPDGASPAGTMPAIAWTGSNGTATMSHLPSFVLVPFAAAGFPRPWDVSRVMDAVALTTLVVASLIWLQRTRSRRWRAGQTRAEAHG